MKALHEFCISYRRALLAALVMSLIGGSCWLAMGQAPSPPATRLIARGAGTTMLEGGSGAPDYMPVLTKVAFYVRLVDGVVTGAFECLAFGPSAVKGEGSGNFVNNIMYVTGNIETARVEGDTIRFSGNSECTGIGAGSNVPFEAVIQKGGPGATVWLRGGSPPQIFKEILVEGSFEIPDAP
jgi:hypothetical protein